MNNVWDHVHLLQDLDPKLSHWFSTRLDAQQVIRRFFPYARSRT
jgi:hypothetical protein